MYFKKFPFKMEFSLIRLQSFFNYWHCVLNLYAFKYAFEQ